MAIITDSVLQCKGIFSRHIHLGSGWLQSACAWSAEEHKRTVCPKLNLKIWQHNLRVGLAAPAVYCQTSIMWRPCISASRRMQCLFSFFSCCIRLSLVIWSWKLHSVFCNDPLYRPVGTNAKPCDKQSGMAVFCGTRRAYKAFAWQPRTEAFGWVKGPVDNFWVRLQVHRILTMLRGLFSRTACHSHDYFLFCFLLSRISRRLQCGHIYILRINAFLNSFSNSAQGRTSGAWTSQMHGHKFVRGPAARRPRFLLKLRHLAAKVCWHAWISWKTWHCFGWAQSLLCKGPLVYSRTVYPGVMPALRKC